MIYSGVNPATLLRNAETDAALKACGCEKALWNGGASDYEYFARLLEMLHSLRGTNAWRSACRTLSTLLGKDLSARKSFDQKEIAELWRAACERMSDWDEVPKNYIDPTADVNAHSLLNDVEKCNFTTVAPCPVFDLRSLDFVKPDPYHAGLAATKKNSGEKLNKEERAILISEEIYFLLTKNKCEKTQLMIIGDGHTEALRSLVEYIKKLGANAELHLAVTRSASVTAPSLLCLADERTSIIPTAMIERGENGDGGEDGAENKRAALQRFASLLPYYPVYYYLDRNKIMFYDEGK